MTAPSKVFRFFLLALGIPVAAAALSACGDDEGSSTSAEDADFTIVADNVEWDTDRIEAPADRDFTIAIDNRDDGVQHNLHVKDAPDEPATELEAGPVVQTLTVNLPEGEYEYICDLHPAMVGTIVARPGPPPGGGGGGGGEGGGPPTSG